MQWEAWQRLTLRNMFPAVEYSDVWRDRDPSNDAPGREHSNDLS